ncbi:MAG: hypothetical protein K5695_01200 [Oscillospiraceae bacterium]|nr:hypothetical protein [Oscillospiraceae bacterium]
MTDKRYDVINDKLKELFGEREQLMEGSAKCSVGSGEEMRFYLLEESEVKDDSGKVNGFYLRIQDVTEGEHELKVKEEQIGQITQ